MSFTVREHGGISPETFERPFFLKHFAPYRFSRELVKGKVVLEIGFGDGYGSSYLAPHAKKFFSIDLFHRNTVSASNKYKDSKLKFITMNGYQLAFKNKSFDTILSFQVIEHIPRTFHSSFLQDIGRVLKEKGIFVLTTPNLLKLKKKNKPQPKSPHHDLEFTPEMLKELLKDYFRNVKIYSVDYSPKQRFFVRLKKMGLFKYLPDSLSPVSRYFNNMKEDDFIVKGSNIEEGVDLLAVCSNFV